MTNKTLPKFTHSFETATEVGHRTAVKYATEAIGTLLLVFTVGAVTRGGSPLAPLAVGAVLMAMVYAGGHVSGAHYNPAVTVAAFVRGRIGQREAVGYVAAQVVGGLIGAALVGTVVPQVPSAPLAPSGHMLVAVFVAEMLFTFALSYVVLNVATSKDHPDNSFYGLAIGFTVAAGAIAVGGVSGGVFNPAVLIGGAAMGMFAGSTLWVYLLAQVAAGVAAGFTFRALNPGDG
ncbi:MULTISPECIES: MIP/aquaporin family protein [unclassified Mycobacterium]|uniref:MIP/aquaporin family protein n=1 Tax=unclassified Mycobacterium TaxID=2642494 RepID=UPI0029C821ED|nr:MULTISPECIES: aquaporin [unclassified Mycobacterium]